MDPLTTASRHIGLGMLGAALLAASGCTNDTNLQKTDDTAGPGLDDSDDTASVETADTEDSAETGETAETGPEETGPEETGDTGPQECPDADYPEMEATESAACPRAVTPAWELEEVWSTQPAGLFTNTPVAAPLWDDNGDGVIDASDPPGIPLVGAGPNKSNVVAALDARDGSVRWTTGTMPLWEGSTPAIADVDRDGTVEILFMSWRGNRALNGEDGTTQWVSRGLLGEVSRGAATLTDFEGDGAPEVVFGPTILDATYGLLVTLAASTSYGSGYGYGGECPMSIAADMDDDGIQELVLGPTVMRLDGSPMLSGKGADGYPAVGEFDGDRYPEIVVSRADEVCLYDNDGTELWCAPVPAATWGSAPPVVADLDGDGQVEIVAAAEGWVGAFDAIGNPLWVDDRTTGSPPADVLFDGVIAYDLDADGAAEVLAATRTGLRIVHGASGALLAELPTDLAWNEGQTPVVVDADGDGSVEILYSHWDARTFEQTLYLLRDRDGFAAGRRVWSQNAFSDSVIRDDMTLPIPSADVWVEDNAFRAAGTGMREGDLSVQVRASCAEACADGRLSVWYSLANHTGVEVPGPFLVELHLHDAAGARLVRTETWSDPLPPLGVTAARRVDLSGVSYPVDSVYAHIVGARDCDPANDVDESGPVVCE